MKNHKQLKRIYTYHSDTLFYVIGSWRFLQVLSNRLGNAVMPYWLLSNSVLVWYTLPFWMLYLSNRWHNFKKIFWLAFFFPHCSDSSFGIITSQIKWSYSMVNQIKEYKWAKPANLFLSLVMLLKQIQLFSYR